MFICLFVRKCFEPSLSVWQEDNPKCNRWILTIKLAGGGQTRFDPQPGFALVTACTTDSSRLASGRRFGHSTMNTTGAVNWVQLQFQFRDVVVCAVHEVNSSFVSKCQDAANGRLMTVFRVRVYCVFVLSRCKGYNNEANVNDVVPQ